MKITRRQFIHATCASAMFISTGSLSAALGQKAVSEELFPIPAEAYSEPIFSMTSKQLRAFLGSHFTATPESGKVTRLILTEVNQLERSQNILRGYYGESFSLIFEGEAPRPLGQGVYVMRTSGLDSFSALVVPTGRDRTQYEIIVNHITR